MKRWGIFRRIRCRKSYEPIYELLIQAGVEHLPGRPNRILGSCNSPNAKLFKMALPALANVPRPFYDSEDATPW